MEKISIGKPPMCFDFQGRDYKPRYVMMVCDSIITNYVSMSCDDAKNHFARILRTLNPRPGQLKIAEIFKVEPVVVKSHCKIIERSTVVATSLYLQPGEGFHEEWTAWMDEVLE